MTDIKLISSEKLIDWYEKLCYHEYSPHNLINSLPYSIEDTREEIDRRFVEHKWYSQKYGGPYKSEIDDMIANDRNKS